MQIKDMFAKDIEREIQGVIIVGQGESTNVKQELEEYVVTRELQKHFAEFFEAYKKGIVGYTNEVGVWISGFFGSGKSHFLKILSYLLANKEVDGKRAIDYFIDDNKINDPMVLADMKLAASTPTDVILFNIDSKSESTSKQDKDAIVNVFLRVFNEMQGFCGALPHLADLESQLTDIGKFEEFKEAFEDEYGKKWEDARHKFDFIQDTVVEVLSDIGFMSEDAARNWCEKATEAYKISIEDFAKRVREYLSKKEKNHHVVFMVDEVGQYIGEDSRLMLSLQTVREELSKECKGKAWVVVTSQQDVDSITNVKGNDFSKIQGRFNPRLSLSSADVGEVIRRRILAKNDTGAQTLRLLYGQKATIIKNLIVFNDGVEKKLYADADDFADVYPFVPYQFNLLASVLTSIRTHGASGKHLSEGERSMLAMFKESVCSVKTDSEGTIIPFHRFYDALENFLDHSHKGVIVRAFDNSYINPDKKTSDVFAIDVLKTLFMIKYVLEIEANVENITSLMISSIDTDRLTLKKDVEEALKVLERQMLIQKNGNLYIFLTDEEQEINNEIEKQQVDIAEVINKVSEMIFEDIFTDKRYKYPAFNGRYTFPFNQIVDDRVYKMQSADIGLRILTPWYEGVNSDQALRSLSAQGKEVVVLLSNDSEFLEEIRKYLKIEKFLRLNTSSKLTKYETIKEAKRVEMRERNSNAKTYLVDGLKNATIYVNGDVVKTSSKEVVSRINETIGKLVTTVYHKLSYITAAMTEVEVRKLFKQTNQITLNLESGEVPNQHALDDVIAYISTNSNIHMKTSMKNLKDRFMRAPYGFVDDDIHWLVAKLFKQGDLLFTVNGATVSLINKSEDEIIELITKKQYVEKLLMDKKVGVSEKDKKAVRSVMKELFGTAGSSDDDEKILMDFQKYAGEMVTELEVMSAEYAHYAYPGEKEVNDGKKLIKSILQINDTLEFFSYVSKNQDTFLDMAEDIEPVKAFFNSEQKDIFTQTLKSLAIYDDSKQFIVDDDLEAVVKQMKEIIKKSSPYTDIPKLPGLRKQFIDAYGVVLNRESVPVIASIDADRDRVLEVLSAKTYEAEYSGKYSSMFMEIKDGAEKCNNVSSLRGFADKANALKIRLLNEMDAKDAKIAADAAKVVTPSAGDGPDIPPTPVAPVVKNTKNVSAKSVVGSKTWRLESEEDIDHYLNALRTSLKNELSKCDILNIEF